MTIQSLEQLRIEFLHEAQSAPKLFKDLAKVEQYIAESYKTRALIELIQNADDAQSTSFGLHSIDGGFIVGNNGRTFTTEDVESLCRSGSSNKQRGGNTIGYRGIGFKSVVNIANTISVFSGEFSFSFDRTKTKNALQNDVDVPLIRVPHPIAEIEETALKQAFELKEQNGYTTIFVFKDVVGKLSLEELSDLDRSSLLFLNNLRNLNIAYQNIHRKIVVDHLSTKKRQTVVRICEAENRDEWVIESSEKNSIDRIAFKKINGTIVPALPVESVIHSFTPTHEFAGAYFKINGDFTTDPSRKAVDWDDLSKESFANSVSILVDSISSILNGDFAKKGFFSPFVNVQSSDSSRFKSLLFRAIETGLQKTEILTRHNTIGNFSDIRLKPEWLNYEDYENLCFNSIASIPKTLISTYPELFSFLSLINVKVLSLEEVIQQVNSANISVMGSAQIYEKIIKQFRYDLDADKIERLKTLKLFPSNNGFVKTEAIKKAEEINVDFRAYLNNNTDLSDIELFYKKLDIKPEEQSKNIIIAENNESSFAQKNDVITVKTFKYEPAIKKWRSAEQNAAEYMKSVSTVLSVRDVTQANLGYDLEVMLLNGKRIYIEIKSVATFSEPFKISNNEYTSAHSYGKDYLIALVINDEPFQIRFVPDPIKTLSFEKKCERWSWFCEQYGTELHEVTEVF